MKLSLTYYFLLFMIYSSLGWTLEVICKIKDSKKFINRGFLIGPYCPIYGWGGVLITFLLYRYSYDPLVLFVMTVITCGILEYLTSYFMEKLFKARWWDYSKRRFNINGRVCLGTIVPFGLFGLILTYITNPFIIDLLNKIEENKLNIISIILASLLAIDYLVSTYIIIGFKETLEKVSKENVEDDTEKISKKVKEVLSVKSWGYKRLVSAFPNFETIKIKIREITEDVKKNAKELKDNINEKAEDMKNALYEKKEEVKNNINEKTENMKNTITGKGQVIVNKIKYNKRKIKINYNLGKRKLKRLNKRGE